MFRTLTEPFLLAQHRKDPPDIPIPARTDAQPTYAELQNPDHYHPRSTLPQSYHHQPHPPPSTASATSFDDQHARLLALLTAHETAGLAFPFAQPAEHAGVHRQLSSAVQPVILGEDLYTASALTFPPVLQSPLSSADGQSTSSASDADADADADLDVTTVLDLDLDDANTDASLFTTLAHHHHRALPPGDPSVDIMALLSRSLPAAVPSPLHGLAPFSLGTMSAHGLPSAPAHAAFQPHLALGPSFAQPRSAGTMPINPAALNVMSGVPTDVPSAPSLAPMATSRSLSLSGLSPEIFAAFAASVPFSHAPPHGHTRSLSQPSVGGTGATAGPSPFGPLFHDAAMADLLASLTSPAARQPGSTEDGASSYGSTPSPAPNSTVDSVSTAEDLVAATNVRLNKRVAASVDGGKKRSSSHSSIAKTAAVPKPLPSLAVRRRERASSSATGGHSSASSSPSPSDGDDGDSTDSAAVSTPTDRKPSAGPGLPKRFACPHPGCGRAFARQFNLGTHFETHDPNRAKPFVCGHRGCGNRGFARKHDLHRHIQSIHNVPRSSKQAAGAGSADGAEGATSIVKTGG